eukprot:3861909-Karenia_brevis.AAC.1
MGQENGAEGGNLNRSDLEGAFLAFQQQNARAMETNNKFLFDTITASFHERAERTEKMCAENAVEITELQ